MRANLSVIVVLLLCTLPGAALAAMHPSFQLLDGEGKAEPGWSSQVSQSRTCGQCHDVAEIDATSTHRAAGVDADCLTCHLDGDPSVLWGAGTIDERGYLRTGLAMPGSPSDQACGTCHGLVHKAESPVEFPADFLRPDGPREHRLTMAAGEIFSPQLRSQSFINLVDKAGQVEPWDVHAARGLSCISCHGSSNGPFGIRQTDEHLEHLKKDPRRPEMGEYLKRPSHALRKVDCTTCHEPAVVHDSLPFFQKHMDALSCQACHIRRISGPALMSLDETVVTPEGLGTVQLRGVDGSGAGMNARPISGFVPPLLPTGPDGRGKLRPYNLVSTWRWVSGDGKPVSSAMVKAAWMSGDSYAPEVLALLDTDGNGLLEGPELRLDTDQKVALIKSRLEALGVVKPEIRGEVQANSINHSVTTLRDKSLDCNSCHSRSSRLVTEVALGGLPPAGAGLVPDPDSEVKLNGALTYDGAARLSERDDGGHIYLLGLSRRDWSDNLGMLIFVLSALGVLGHGALRILSRKKHAVSHDQPLTRVYMYSVYERIWHWMMALSVILLILTGLEIHFTGSVAVLGFATAVPVHNLIAAMLLLNAFLALFQHMTTGEIKQFIPVGKGFISGLMIQARFYIRGIFTGAAHPFLKTPRKKLNPLQQLTYFGLLNFLFPLQVTTGVLLWVGGLEPSLLVRAGGLAWVTPIHNLGSWLFTTFLFVHIYLTTTGHTVTSNIKAMVTGFEDIEEASTLDKASATGGSR